MQALPSIETFVRFLEAVNPFAFWSRFSPLKSINTDNVAHLSLAYSFQLGSLRSNESTPLVIGDTMYVSTSWGP